ncbi:hypothetical protein F6V30_15790 [Oryzomonas sagensis]|uniref:Putative Flp pilus-assembly TadG-like N-terminal domain-containing protein n=1 Tax=Oryzomonas sagensis TaxID=2603857 RepID=A0ABQ6TKF1_9BACT|nr:pilus assembly protein TadG-related protein [Oryzomonas sagensis]KAB0668561.1 hypothetical protein F6V30_15790 [Oryzomonas sagensis]
MDAARRVNRLNNGGSALVLITVSLVVLIVMAGLAIDLAYMYANKAQLQKTADAGALAGAGRLNGTTFTTQTGARKAAVHMGKVNFNLTMSPNIGNDPSGDVVLGYWNPTATPPQFTTTPPAVPPGTPPPGVNAVKVVARRIDSSDNGIIGTSTPFNLFLGGAAGHSTMGAVAAAVAWRPPAARYFFLINQDVCNQAMSAAALYRLYPQNKVSTTNPQKNMAWTSLSGSFPSADSIFRGSYICPVPPPNVDVCYQSIDTSGGTNAATFQGTSLDFYDPNYDAIEKTAAGWTILVPYATPGTDPTTKPATVAGYAKITINNACPTGGNPCNLNGRTNPAPSGPSDPCKGISNGIYISSAICYPCGSIEPGALPSLAQ